MHEIGMCVFSSGLCNLGALFLILLLQTCGLDRFIFVHVVVDTCMCIQWVPLNIIPTVQVLFMTLCGLFYYPGKPNNTI